MVSAQEGGGRTPLAAANVVMLGATRGMGRALARRFAERGSRIILLGRDEADLDRSTADLMVRGSHYAGFARCDLEEPGTFAAALDSAERLLGRIDTVIVTAGLFATQEQLEADRELTHRLLAADFTNTVLFCEEARKRMAPTGGTLCVFSSVAGERGRKPVVLYGAAKAGLTRYLEALDHRYRATGLKVICVKPGFVRTAMTDGLPEPPFAADADSVAATVMKAIDRGTPVVYAPPIWTAIMAVIRLLPRFVMRRVGF
jgi:NAD(P)-dependent dehydrogenase (short-subunit alcohol dehydrogenase family)